MLDLSQYFIVEIEFRAEERPEVGGIAIVGEPIRSEVDPNDVPV